MTTIYLIRHGQAEAGWSEQRDPGLDDTGRRQAEQAALALSGLGPLPILVSPLRRARETAYELEMLWRQPATVESRVAEIPSPSMTLAERGAWLKSLTRQRWQDLDEVIQGWRREAIQCLLEISQNTVVVSHFMIINAVVSWVRGEEGVVCCHPIQGSRTTLERDGETFRVLELGAQGPSTLL